MNRRVDGMPTDSLKCLINYCTTCINSFPNYFIWKIYFIVTTLMEQRENLLDVLRIFFKWLKPITYLCLGIGIGTALISLLLPNYYESTTTFYAASMDQAKPSHIFGTSTRDIDFYGDDRDNDRLLTIAESNELADFIIQKFDLYSHYDIDPTKEKGAFNVLQKFNKHYSVIKTKRDAIELSMEDRDKELATQMVNLAREKINEFSIRIVKQQLYKKKESLEKNIQEKSANLAVLSDSLITLKNKFGIYNTESQAEVFAEQILATESKLARDEARLNILKSNKSISTDTLSILTANVAGLKSQLSNLNKKNKNFNQGQSLVLVLERQQKDMSNKLSVEKVELNQLITAFSSEISAINLIEAGAIPIIKSRPKRSIIVISAVLIAFVFSFIGVLLFESYKDINWKEIIKN